MIKKYKCDFCQSYFTKEQLDGQFVCPQCYQDIDPQNFKLFGSKNKEDEDQDEQFEDQEDEYEDEQQYDDQQLEDQEDDEYKKYYQEDQEQDDDY